MVLGLVIGLLVGCAAGVFLIGLVAGGKDPYDPR